MIKRICVYCGSSDKTASVYLDAAYQMGQVIAAAQLTLVYGAGKTGMMGAVANGVLEAGGEVWGIMPKIFDLPHLAHADLQRYEVVDTMHARKARMAELADGFIALPGGFGTFEELFEIITWVQIGLHQKPIGLLNTQGYYNHLMAMIEHADTEGFVYSEHKQIFTQAEEPAELLEALQQHRLPAGLEKWVDRE